MTTVMTALPDAPGFLDVDHLYGKDKMDAMDFIKIKLYDEKRAPVAEFATNAANFMCAIFNQAKLPGTVRQWQTEEIEPVPAEPPRRADTGMTDFEQAVALLRDAARALNYRHDRKVTQAAIVGFLAYLDEGQEGAA